MAPTVYHCHLPSFSVLKPGSAILDIRGNQAVRSAFIGIGGSVGAKEEAHNRNGAADSQTSRITLPRYRRRKYERELGE